jgi:hypothetical protein
MGVVPCSGLALLANAKNPIPSHTASCRAECCCCCRKKVPDGGCSRCARMPPLLASRSPVMDHNFTSAQTSGPALLYACRYIIDMCAVRNYARPRPFPWIYAAFHAHHQRPCNCCKQQACKHDRRERNTRRKLQNRLTSRSTYMLFFLRSEYVYAEINPLAALEPCQKKEYNFKPGKKNCTQNCPSFTSILPKTIHK